MARLVVVGSGVAGLSVALRASRHHDVTVITKSSADDGATRWAQGGIAAAFGSDDSTALHTADTLSAGAGLADPDAVAALCDAAPDRVRELAALGAAFDRIGGADSAFALGREAAHSRARIVHAGGDATGAAVEAALLTAVAGSVAAGRIDLVEHEMLVDLLVEEGAVRGIRTLDAAGRWRERAADAVLLATGGAGRMFRHTTAPAVATGDGIAAALRAGALVRDLEFVQFHPTALAVPSTPLVSEAVRGAGAVLRDAAGRRFMVDRHPDAELAPRDVVAREVAAAMRRHGGRPVLLDATAVTGLADRFPGLTRMTREHGLDWTREPVPVTPAAHYLMGGIATDLDGRTSLPGLLAVGECASTGVHGANRLASNSLLEGLVFGQRAADAVGEPATDAPRASRTGGSAPVADDRPVMTRAALADLMWERVGVERDAVGLRDALARLDGPDELDSPAELIVRGAAGAADAHRAQEDRNLHLLARETARAALARRGSVGAHHRADDPAAPASAATMHAPIPTLERLSA